MHYNEKAWGAALQLARSESRDPLMRGMADGRPAPKSIREGHEDVKTRALTALADRADFDRYLESAREYVSLEKAREEAVRGSLLGDLMESVTDVASYDYKSSQQMGEIYLKGLDPLFEDVRCQELWRLFLEALAGRSFASMFEALRGLLDAVEKDLYAKPLPPAPRLPDEPEGLGLKREALLFFQVKEAVVFIADEAMPLAMVQKALAEKKPDTPDWDEFVKALEADEFGAMAHALALLINVMIQEFVEQELPL